jgi:hypothetical protein
MRDFETMMLAIYNETVEKSLPFVKDDLIMGLLQADLDAMGMLFSALHQRGFVGSSPMGTLALSADGIWYVESRLRG